MFPSCPPYADEMTTLISALKPSLRQYFSSFLMDLDIVKPMCTTLIFSSAFDVFIVVLNGFSPKIFSPL